MVTRTELIGGCGGLTALQLNLNRGTQEEETRGRIH